MVAAAVRVSQNAVQQWLCWCRAGGMAEVRSHRRGGNGTHIVSVWLDCGLVVGQTAVSEKRNKLTTVCPLLIWERPPDVGPVLLALGEKVMQGRVCLLARGRA